MYIDVHIGICLLFLRFNVRDIAIMSGMYSIMALRFYKFPSVEKLSYDI